MLRGPGTCISVCGESFSAPAWACAEPWRSTCGSGCCTCWDRTSSAPVSLCQFHSGPTLGMEVKACDRTWEQHQGTHWGGGGTEARRLPCRAPGRCSDEGVQQRLGSAMEAGFTLHTLPELSRERWGGMSLAVASPHTWSVPGTCSGHSITSSPTEPGPGLCTVAHTTLTLS